MSARRIWVTMIPDGQQLFADGVEVKVGDTFSERAQVVGKWTWTGIEGARIPPPKAYGFAIVDEEAPPYVSRRAQIAGEIADRLIADLTGAGVGGCICDDLSGDARRCIVQAIEDAMTQEAETT